VRRAVTFAIGTAAAVALAATVISSSRATLGRAGNRTSAEEIDSVQIEILATAGPSPTPLTCPGCWNPVTLSENFDAVTPPALPNDWLATNALGPPPLWVTSDSGVPMPPADTAPNAVFVDDPGVVSDKRVDSFQFDLFETADTMLTFRHNFDLEASSVDPNLGYDGAVLEASTDGGNTFQDIIEVGGSFVTGGYNRTISSDRGSPIAGRKAWSGNSQGFMTTVVRLPDTQKQTRLRWRMASDSIGSGEGWRVDTVNLSWCRGEGTPCPTATPRPTPTPRLRPTPLPRPPFSR
jgi:hypothetical protein